MSLDTSDAGSLMRAFARCLKAAHAVLRIAPRVPTIEPAAYPMMFRLLNGPHRISDLAEATFCDVSVASRTIATLRENSLVTKEPDPADRRASLVSLTDEGRRELDTTMRLRAEFMSQVLTEWPAADAQTFTTLLDRFADDLERTIAAGLPPKPTTSSSPTTEPTSESKGIA